MLEEANTRDQVSLLPLVPLSKSLLVPRHVLGDENAFWQQCVDIRLSPRNESVATLLGLKDKLRGLRNLAVRVLRSVPV